MTSRNTLDGFGIQSTGSGNISVGRDLHIGSRETYIDQLLVDLCPSDPRDDKTRIETTKGGLLKDSYRWILKHRDYLQWRDGQENRMLWIRGDPGKGKTMLLCGIIDELQSCRPAYFFCQATDSHLNNATTVLRGLIYMLIRQTSHLSSYLRDDYKANGKRLFEGPNSWFAMSRILRSILVDPDLNGQILMIDGLDECVENQHLLLEFLSSPLPPQIRWIVSSRNWPVIEDALGNAPHSIPLCLELNENSISAAVEAFIQHKASELALRKKLNNEKRAIIQRHFTENAENTFLWVALAYQELADPKVRARHTIDTLMAFPRGLYPLFKQMMDYIRDSNDSEVCHQILAVCSIVYRPIAMVELASMLQPLAEYGDEPSTLREIIGSCGSFLTVRDEVVYFIHQSVKDFLLQHEEARSMIFPLGLIKRQHFTVAVRSMEVMSERLQRDIYQLGDPAVHITDAVPKDADPLYRLRYCCLHWAEHVRDALDEERLMLNDLGIVRTFLESKFLCWLEALSLLRNTTQAVSSIRHLQDLEIASKAPQLAELLKDADRFIKYNRETIDDWPLQIYASALVFSPTGSLVRKLFRDQEPKWITSLPQMDADWGSSIHFLSDDTNLLCSGPVVFSPDGLMVTSGGVGGRFVLWDAVMGAKLQVFRVKGKVITAAFTSDGSHLVTVCSDGAVGVWNVQTGHCRNPFRLDGLEDLRTPVMALSADGSNLVSTVGPDSARIWKMRSGTLDQSPLVFRFPSVRILSVAFAPNGEHFAVGSDEGSVWILEAHTGKRIHQLGCLAEEVTSLAFSPDCKTLVSASDGYEMPAAMRIWEVATGSCLHTLASDHGGIFAVTYSLDGKILASASGDQTIRIWHPGTGLCLQILAAHSLSAGETDIALSPAGDLLAAASFSDHHLRIWELPTIPQVHASVHASEVGRSPISLISCSLNGRMVAASPLDGIAELWRADANDTFHPLLGPNSSNWVTQMAFSPDSKMIALGFDNGIASIWDTITGTHCQEFVHDGDHVDSLAFSWDNTELATSTRGSIYLWNIDTNQRIYRFRDRQCRVSSVSFSRDGMLLAVGYVDGRTVSVWTKGKETVQSTFAMSENAQRVTSVAFSPDGSRVAAGIETARGGKVLVGETRTGTIILTLQGHRDVFGWDEKWLRTDRGILFYAADVGLLSNELRGIGCDDERKWIQKDGVDVLRLPSDFEPWGPYWFNDTPGSGPRSAEADLAAQGVFRWTQNGT